jgi:anti-sigma B factor antagonist
MEIRERMFDDVTVLDVSGKILLGEGDVQLRSAIQNQIDAGRRKLVLNLADVPYIDSAGLGEMVRCYTTVSRDGGSLRLLNATSRIRDLLTITKLITVFDHYETEEDAIRSFQ